MQQLRAAQIPVSAHGAVGTPRLLTLLTGNSCRPQPSPHVQTLATFKQGGCLFSVPAVLALGAASTVYAAQAVWRNAPPPCPVSPAAALSPLAPSRRTS